MKLTSRGIRLRGIDDAQVLHPPRCLGRGNHCALEVVITLAVEDNHRHAAPVIGAVHVLPDDVHQHRRLASASTANEHTVFDPDKIRPLPRLIVNRIAKQRGLGISRSPQVPVIQPTADREWRIWPVPFPLPLSCDVVTEHKTYAEQPEHYI
jgi:hypothetical protein